MLSFRNEQGCDSDKTSYHSSNKSMKFNTNAIVSAKNFKSNLVQSHAVCKNVPDLTNGSPDNAWITLSDENITARLKSTTNFITTMNIGSAYADYTYIEGHPDKNADCKYAKPSDPPSSYGSTYLKVGIHTVDMDAIVDFMEGFHGLSIDKANLSTTMHGYICIKLIAQSLSMAHFGAKLLRTVPQGTNAVSLPYKLSFWLTLFKLSGATQIKLPAIGPVTSVAAIAPKMANQSESMAQPHSNFPGMSKSAATSFVAPSGPQQGSGMVLVNTTSACVTASEIG
ncbi:hypothetical protein BC830DRAFT_1077827 [Chytriomyces sp. MP71]|nr:hypothetical protein BC830DRAFT_1077827 [Chytriomyces sp. MP71]